MKERILKSELYLLFALSVISSFYYFFGSSLPDNSLSITSEATDYTVISYYLSSFFAEISYYVGPWIVIPFIFFAFIYSFIITGREKDSDSFIGVLIVLLFYSLTFFISPNFFGLGLKIISEEYVSIYTAFFSSIIFAFLVFYLTLRGAFFVLLKRVQMVLEKFGYNLIRKTQKITNNSKKLCVGYKEKVTQIDFKIKTKNALKKTMMGGTDLPTAKEDFSSELSAEVVTNEVNDLVSEDKKEDTPEKINKSAKPSKNNFFKSNDLINCISSSINHKKITGPDENYFKTSSK